MVLQIEDEKCIGCGVCTSMLDSVFEMDDEIGLAKIITTDGAKEKEILEAVESCPIEAISI